jgi:hypothetical protein
MMVDGGTQWTFTETSFVGKKWLCNSKKEDHCKLKKRKGLGLVSNFQLGEGKKSQN